MTAVRWRILLLLFAVSFVAYVLRTNVSVAGEPMMSDLGLSRVQLGAILAAFAWGYAIFQVPGGVLNDLVGTRRGLALIAASWGVLNLLMGLVHGRSLASPTIVLGVLIALRFLMGVAQAPVYPMTGANVCQWFPVAGWALPNALTNVGLTLGAAATGPLIAWLMETVGWRLSFVLTAPLGLLVAAAWWWYARDTPAEHRSVSPAELELIDRDRAPARQAAPARGAWKQALRDRDVLLLSASYFCSNYVYYFFFNWLYIYLVEHRGFTVLEGGAYSAAPWLTGALGAALGGVACDSLCRRCGMERGCRWPSVLGLVLMGAFLLAAAESADPIRAVVFLSLCLGCQQFTEGPFWAAIIAVGGRRCATACGVLNTGGNLVGGIGALLVPLTVERFGWGPALVTASVFAILAAALWLPVHIDESRSSRPTPTA